MIQGSDLPTVNAVLNSMSACLLISAFWAVKNGRYALHRNLMIVALVTSAAFLTSYLIYHFGVQLTKRYEGPFRGVYLAFLLSHTVLAVTVLPLVLVSMAYGLKAQKGNPQLIPTGMKAQFARHRAIARWTFPIWLYVSVTGVVIYCLLYHLPSFLRH